ncbi:MAG TPA: GntR family transcriptional regulator [Steroidobacteraceae bacterium]|nr:GntR family transcriptional regulator [Steroidobacteraceae bacterium]
MAKAANRIREVPATSADIPANIANQIRELIARGGLSPGVRLGQQELAERFEASRMPVREALKLLSAEGIIVHDANRGFFVATLSSDEARQLFKLRHMVEDSLLSSIRWPTEEELRELNRRADELEKLLNSGDRSTWWTRHREFHQMIFELSNEPVIVREAMRLWSLTDRYRSLLPLPQRPSAERALVKKHEIVQALADRDRRKLIRVRAERREQFERLVLEVLQSRSA